MPERDVIATFREMSQDPTVTMESFDEWYTTLSQEEKDELDAFIQEEMKRQCAMMRGEI
jgi:hypothetical protein